MKFGGIPEILVALPVTPECMHCISLSMCIVCVCACLPYSAESMESHAAHLMQTVAECEYGPINMLLPCWPSVTFYYRGVGRTVLRKIVNMTHIHMYSCRCLVYSESTTYIVRVPESKPICISGFASA